MALLELYTGNTYSVDELNDNWVKGGSSKKNSPKVYWTLEQEEAVRLYINEVSPIKKEKIFNEKLYRPLNRLIENIIFSFKLFRSDVDVKSLQHDCLSFVITKFDNFDPDKNTKAFSFFGTIAKHYLMCEKKEIYKRVKDNLDYDEMKEEVDEQKSYYLDQEVEGERSNKLFNYIVEELRKEMQSGHISNNDKKVADAIIDIFSHHELIGLYNKNLVYQLIKERTGLQTKEITYSLHRFRIFYRLAKHYFNKEQDEE